MLIFSQKSGVVYVHNREGSMMKKFISLILCITLCLSLVGCGSKYAPDPEDPVTLNIWHVYGSQTRSPLNDSIDDFNRTVGAENGIIINIVTVSDSTYIGYALESAVNDEPGSPELPDLFTAYPSAAETVGINNLIDWNDYFSPEELGGFIDAFLNEGTVNGKLVMLPVAKSAEVTFINNTLFSEFSAETGVSVSSLSDYEGLFAACKKYYDWSHGRELFQMNEFHNYFLTGMESYGESFIEKGRINISGESFSRLWPSMASAAIYGGLCVDKGYASNRWKTGDIIVSTGSSGAIIYMGDRVIYPDNTSYDIETLFMPFPKHKGGEPTAVHRGSGLFAVKSEDERKNRAAAVFAKWLTQKENNISFVTEAGCIPVTREGMDGLITDATNLNTEKQKSLYNSLLEMYNSYEFYNMPVYKDSIEAELAFEEGIKAVLQKYRALYKQGCLKGEDRQQLLDRLVADSLREFRAVYGGAEK